METTIYSRSLPSPSATFKISLSLCNRNCAVSPMGSSAGCLSSFPDPVNNLFRLQHVFLAEHFLRFLALRIRSDELSGDGLTALFLHAARGRFHLQQSPFLIVVAVFGRADPGKQQAAREREPLGVHSLPLSLQNKGTGEAGK